MPAGDLSKLVKCVSDSVTITNVCGDLAPVLSNVQCRDLGIVSQSLNASDTTAGSAEVDPPRTWTPSVGSRVRGCVILEYINRGQQWNTSSL